MSVSSYRLEAPRARAPPPPLRFQSSSFQSSSVLSLNSNYNPDELLYDLPTASTSPPPSNPQSKPGFISPTSPSFPGRSRAGRSGRPTPPPSSRGRSTTPSGVAPSELERFAGYCRAWYYNQDDNSGRLMTQTLTDLPPAQRAPFSRLQASIRSAYHASMNARRTAEFQAHLSATQPGGSLLPHSRSDPAGSVARKERYERLDRFVRNWCTMGMPGTKPFFEGFWAVIRLQVIPEHLGGAGGFLIEWEIDDAVFKEAAGKDFMLEAIDVLKGVLGFSETTSSKVSVPSSPSAKFPEASINHSRAQSQPLPLSKRKAISTTALPIRGRAPSDPFSDTPALSVSVASASNTTSLLSAQASDHIEEPPSPIVDEPFISPGIESNFDDSDQETLRIWTSPDLPNSEYQDLLKVFPAFLTRRPLPRFPVTQSARPADLEEGYDDGREGKEIRFGTGSMWVSLKERGDGWEGSWWARFVAWWRKVFC